MMSELNAGSMRADCSSLASTQTFILKRVGSTAEEAEGGSFAPGASHQFATINLDPQSPCRSSTAIAGTIRLRSSLLPTP
jgi:hypothetical protein